jgi:hypothetical protein
MGLAISIRKAKHCFFEKKPQETVTNWMRDVARVGTEGIEVFWFFLSIKNCFDA